MTTHLITGGAGFIGSHYCHYWAAKYPQDQLIVLDKLTYAGRLENLTSLINQGTITFIKGDICDRELLAEIFEKHTIDQVVHFAAESHVDRSIDDADAFIKTNVLGTQCLLDAARAHNTRFHHVSTDEVYGALGLEDPPFAEGAPYRPNSPYSASKAASNHLARAYHVTYGLPVTISNCSNNYGFRQHEEKLIPKTIHCVLEGKPIPLYGDGKHVRDWLHVDDHCRAIDAIVSSPEATGEYNIAGHEEIPNVQIVETICKYIEEKYSFPNIPKPATSLITPVKDRLGHDRRYALETPRIENQLGFRPAISFEDGIKETIDQVIAKRLSTASEQL
ncbi:MAG: dTDP-glucose 4,6-dehydratase [Alphaproteobacteria bacterium]